MFKAGRGGDDGQTAGVQMTDMNGRSDGFHDGERSTQYSNGDFSHNSLGAKHAIGTGQEAPRRGLFATIEDGWFWEIMSLVFSAACIVALIIFLRVLDGQEVPSWNNSVSPNTVAAVASTAAKAGMILVIAEAIGQFKWLHLHHGSHSLHDIQVYDSATRGPLGALKFLWHFKKAPAVTYIAITGCLITILAIATDPFTQQILRYVTRPTPAPGAIASLKHATAYDFENTGVGSGASSPIVGVRDPGITAAIYGGLYNSTVPIEFSCPSSNCTWPDFTTLGVSSNCTDVTAQTLRSCTTSNETGWQNCLFTLPHSIELTGTTTFDAHSGFRHTLANATTEAPSAEQTEADLVTYASMILFPDPPTTATDSVLNQTAWRDTLRAWQCSLKIVAYAFSNVTVQSGEIQTPNVRTSPLNITFASILINETALATPWPYSGNYTMNYEDLNNFGGVFNELLYYDTYQGGEVNPNVASALTSASNNISGLFEQTALSMTHHMMSSSPNATTNIGTVLYPRTYIEVRWAWLSLQAALLFLTGIFLISAIVLTHSEHQPVWKSSVYPLISLNLRENHATTDLAEPDWRITQMEEVCKRTNTGLFSGAGREKSGNPGGGGTGYSRL